MKVFLPNPVGHAVKVCLNLSERGFDFMGRNAYAAVTRKKDLPAIWKTFNVLGKDPNPGNRFRAYTRFRWNSEQRKLVEDANNDYFQSKEYNYADGGKVRKFSPISPEFLRNHTIQTLVEDDTDIARATEKFEFNDSLEVGLHQIRYRAEPTAPSYSSPVWLHRDDEPLVFVHLLRNSSNLLGGDNLIANGPKEINSVLKLRQPLDTFVVNQKILHAITPMGCTNARPSYRDILLVTFFNKHKKSETSAEIDPTHSADTDALSNYSLKPNQ